MANFSAKYSIMTQEMVDSFCESFYIPAEVHPTAPGRDKTIAQFPAGKVGVYTRIFDVCGYRIPFTKFFMAVLKYFRVHISQLSPFGAARVSHFEVLTRVLDLSPSVTVFRAFYTRTFSDGLFSFAKRSTSAPSCFPKPPDSIKNWADHFFWVDSCVFPISVPLYTGGVLEKDPAPHLTARQEQTVKLLDSHKAPFRRYPECFLCLVGLSPYYPFDDNSYPAFERPDGTDMGLLDFIKTADPRKVRAVEVQKGDDQVTLLESTRHCFMPLVIPAAGGSGYVAATEIPAPTERGQESVAEEDAYLELADPGEGMAMVRQSDEEVVTEQPKKIKKKRLTKQSDVLPAKRLRTDHPSLASGTGGKTLAGLEQIMSEGSHLLVREQSATLVAPPQESESFMDLSAQASLQIRTTVWSSSTLSAPVDTAAATTTSSKAKLAADVNPDLAGPSQLEESEGSDDSFYELATLDPSEAKRWAARQICLGSEVRSRAEHELELKEKLNAKYAARGKLLEKKDSEILRLKSQLAEKEAETAEVVRLRDQVSSLSGEKSALTAEVSALKVTITQKDHDISLLDSRATHLESALNDAQVACTEAGTKITSLASERDRLASEVSSLRAGFKDFKEKMEIQQEEQAQELYNRVAELEAHVMNVSGRLEGEFYPTYLTLLVERRWLLTHGIQLALLKCLQSSEYQGILGHALGRAIDSGMQEAAEDNLGYYFMDTTIIIIPKRMLGWMILDCFLLDGPLAELLEVASVQTVHLRVSFPVFMPVIKRTSGETLLIFRMMNVHARCEGVDHAAALSPN
ncbi:hypothetical protein Tco_0705944 [Tanacetum coccineum]|uniref:Transposase (putative) gypsy type domain-containing protein n=1 Tax=Tanacetum coccineum TaxID=301880 RepID=A0ABQ4Y7K3_9ASTR